MELSYDDWQAALEQEFFDGRNAGRSFWFFIDDEVVQSIAIANGAAGGLEAFERLGVSYCGNEEADGIFAGAVRSRLRRWLSGPRDTAPPVLPVLAITVLAGTRMQEAEGVSQTNYYRRLRQMLDLRSGSGQPKGFADNVIRYWKCLREWSDRQEELIGRLLVPSDPYPPYVGYPVSQALWRRVDSDQLAKALWDHLGDQLPKSRPEDLEPLARHHVVDRELLPPRARRIFTDDRLVEIRHRVLEDLLDAPPPGDTEAGRQMRQRRREVILRGRASPRLDLSFVAPRAAHEPMTLQAVTGSGEVVQCRASEHLPDFYRLEGVAVDDRALSEGFSLSTEFGSWAFEPHDLIVLAQHPELSLATTRLDPAGRVVILTASDIPELAPTRPSPDPSLPTGWLRYDGVDPETALPEGVAAALEAAEHQQLELRGGLTVRPRTYLATSLPEVVVAEELTRVSASIDGREVVLRAEGGTARLPAASLPEGRHRVQIGDALASFVVTNGLAPMCSYSRERSLEVSGTRVSGAYLDPEPEPPVPRPLVASSRAERVLLLGASPDEVDVIHQTDTPLWLSHTPLHSRAFEIRPRFTVVWAVELLPTGPKCRLVEPSEPHLEGNDIDPEWIEAVRKYVPDSDHDALGRDYVAAAHRLHDGEAPG